MVKRFEESAARLRVVGSEAEESLARAVFESMLDGWRCQRLARNLAETSIEGGARIVRRFGKSVGSYPWQWTPADLERFMAELRREQGLVHTTVRNYALTIAAFQAFVCDPAYGFDRICLERFGTHPVQI